MVYACELLSIAARLAWGSDQSPVDLPGLDISSYGGYLPLKNVLFKISSSKSLCQSVSSLSLFFISFSLFYKVLLLSQVWTLTCCCFSLLV